MARIVQQDVITTSGVSFENEPIIKSDGSGEIMQWQPSDGGADGVFIIQDASTCSAEPYIKIINKKPITPSKTEIASNPRSRSAKMGESLVCTIIYRSFAKYVY